MLTILLSLRCSIRVESMAEEVHIKHWVQAKEGGNVKLKSIFTHILGDCIGSIVEWENIWIGSCKAFFLLVKPNFISRLKLVWHSVLIMVLRVLGIGLLQNIWNMSPDVLDFFQ
jgi:hypothetical protein